MFHWEGEVMEGFSETLIWRNHVRKRNIVLSRCYTSVYRIQFPTPSEKSYSHIIIKVNKN